MIFYCHFIYEILHICYGDLPYTQQLPPARGGTAQRNIFHLVIWSQLIHPGPLSSRSWVFMESVEVFMESNQSCMATLTHYSTEQLTTGPDYDPLLLLLSIAGDVHPNPGPPRYPARSASRTSLAKVPAICVQDARIGYIQDVLVFETLRLVMEPMAGSVPPVGHHHSLVPFTRSQYQTRRSTYYSMASATNRRN